MSDTAWYFPALVALHDRMQHTEKMLTIMDEKSEELDLKQRKKVLSIGPGYGRLDVPLLTSHCPLLTHYIGVEPDKSQVNILQDRLDRELINRNVKIDVVVEKAECWSGPEEPVDLIILSEVMYYIPDREAFYQRCKEWLAPGGVLVMVHAAYSRNIFNYIAEHFGTATFYHAELTLQELNKLGWQDIKHESHSVEMDIRDRNPQIMKFLLQKDADIEEIAALDTLLCEIVPTGIITTDLRVIWWTKH